MRWLLIALLLAPEAGLAQDAGPVLSNQSSSPPRCSPAMDGQVMCRFGALYECSFTNPNAMERHTGWQWKMDVLRSCDTAPAPADMPDSGQGGLPPGFTYVPQSGNYDATSSQTSLPTTAGSGSWGGTTDTRRPTR